MLRIHRTVLIAALGLLLSLPALESSTATSVATPVQQTPETQRVYRYTDLGVLGVPVPRAVLPGASTTPGRSSVRLPRTFSGQLTRSCGEMGGCATWA
jgi:hypothetical protein